jgi:hypothetical protein
MFLSAAAAIDADRSLQDAADVSYRIPQRLLRSNMQVRRRIAFPEDYCSTFEGGGRKPCGSITADGAANA